MPSFHESAPLLFNGPQNHTALPLNVANLHKQQNIAINSTLKGFMIPGVLVKFQRWLNHDGHLPNSDPLFLVSAATSGGTRRMVRSPSSKSSVIMLGPQITRAISKLAGEPPTCRAKVPIRCFMISVGREFT